MDRALIPSSPIGRSGLSASVLSFGSAPIGNLLTEVKEEQAVDAVNAAWETGVRYFDTAPHYGLGLAEQRLGKALSEYPRSEYLLSTKVGRLLEPTDEYPGQNDLADGFLVPKSFTRKYDYSADAVKRSIEASLKRLGTESIDIVFVHDPVNYFDEAMAGAFPTLSQMRSEGIIKSFGAGMIVSEMLGDFIRHTDLDVIMLGGRFTLLEQSALDTLLPLAIMADVSIVAAGVFNSGLLSRRRASQDATYNYEPANPEIIQKVNQIAEICERHGVTLPEAAAQFPLGHPAISHICLGARSREQVERNARLLDVKVPKALWLELCAAGFFLPESVPSLI